MRIASFSYFTLWEFTQLYRNRPCIASAQTAELPHWNKQRSEHAVVVVGMDPQYIYLRPFRKK